MDFQRIIDHLVGLSLGLLWICKDLWLSAGVSFGISVDFEGF